jgi:hypothetical protein
MSRRLVLLLAALLVALAVVAARQVVLGDRAMARSDEALERGDARAAIAGAREAAEALVPGSPFPARGHARLVQIARDAEARGDDATAAMAWRAARAAAMETRALGASNDARLAEANAGILRAAIHGAPPQGGALAGADDLTAAHGPASWEILLVACAVVTLYAVWERFLAPRLAHHP